MTTTTDTTEAKQKALAAALECEPEELTLARFDHYGLTVFELGNQEYAIGTDEEADEAVDENIRQSVWAFNPSFILGECGLPFELEDAFRAYQEKECEGANDALLALVEKCAGFDKFALHAVQADGRGHFLSSYDGQEREAGEMFWYRIN
jgi:hypothetical protein